MAFDGFIHIIINDHETNIRQKREVRILQRHLRDVSNPFNLPEALFLKLYRVNKHLCQYLINTLIPHLNAPTRITRIPVHLRILTVLHFLGHGSYQAGLGHGYSFAESQPVVSRCITEITDAITQFLLPEWVKFPQTHENKEEVKRQFQQLDPRFENIVGVIDCTHIRIVSPPANHPIHPGPPYYCRKNFYAINTQIIGDANRIILNINARFPGSVHDSAIWMLSGIKPVLQREYIENGTLNYLIGDSGYPLEPWLLVPFADPIQDSPESRFNTALSRVRVIIEHINGLLKARFRSIHGHRALHYNPARCAKIIYSCAVIHNMCRQFNVPVPLDEDDLPIPPRPLIVPPEAAVSCGTISFLGGGWSAEPPDFLVEQVEFLVHDLYLSAWLFLELVPLHLLLVFLAFRDLESGCLLSGNL
ncbi:hypothetical protein NQ315_012239 [Exocentrus adspersus]|uniref:DDE Tnp4 domain-containing protein n=1 Tax=Exocentrus adspersus TaxID=1586481 RepID=A0AAV8V7Z1_9CUCU|nr:hypothetical protein NQ315_012239 [Exocentrus adspersus]